MLEGAVKTQLGDQSLPLSLTISRKQAGPLEGMVTAHFILPPL